MSNSEGQNSDVESGSRSFWGRVRTSHHDSEVAHEDYTIAIICALAFEADAVHATFDHNLERERQVQPAISDRNAYSFGSIGPHNVVLAHLGRIGKVESSHAATDLGRTFPNIQLCLLVGVCGVVPMTPSGEEIVLGDVVVSTSVRQYDLGRRHEHRFVAKSDVDNSLPRQHARVRNFLSQLATRQMSLELRTNTHDLLQKMFESQKLSGFERPNCETDLLFPPGYRHTHVLESECIHCSRSQFCEEAVTTPCQVLGCDVSKSLSRQRYRVEKFQPDVFIDASYQTLSGINKVEIHLGVFASGDTVLRSGSDRDQIAEEHAAIAFEMEGAGIWDVFPTIVIKGACDYADSHKSKGWQRFAAASAAACAKAVLLQCNVPASNSVLSSLDLPIRSAETGSFIYSIAKQMGKTDHALLKEQLDKETLDSFSFPEMNQRRLTIDHAHPNTCTWLLTSASYRSWLARTKPILWIKGKPGSGKSTMMAYLYDELLTERRSQVGDIYLDFFFNARGAPLQRSVVGMFRSLIYQLYKQSPEEVRRPIRDAFEEKRDAFRSAWEWQRRELESFLATSVKMLVQNTRRISIFVDALDEAGPESAEAVARYFQDFGNIDVVENINLIQVFFSSRHYPTIPTGNAIEICMENNNRNDIQKFILDHMSQPGDNKGLSNDPPWQAVASQLLDRAQGIFQWIRLVVPNVARARREGDDPTDVLDEIRKIPEKLHDVYEHILTQIIEPRRRKRSLILFQWVLFAEKPLSVSDMRFALRSSEAQKFVETDQTMRKLVDALSGGMVEVVVKETPVIEVIHQSVREYFLEEGLSKLMQLCGLMPTYTSSFEKESVQYTEVIVSAQRTLFKACLNYLDSEDVEDYLRLTAFSKVRGLSGEKARREIPFMVYCCTNLLVHGRKACYYEVESAQEILQPLHKAFNNWTRSFQLVDCFSNACPASGMEVVHVAAIANMVGLLQLLARSAPEKLKFRDDLGRMPFHLACSEGCLETTKYLLQVDQCDLNVRSGAGETGMTLAVSRGQSEVVDWLIQQGALENMTNNQSRALQLASSTGHIPVVDILLAAGSTTNLHFRAQLNDALKVAATNGHLSIVKRLLRAGANVNNVGGPYGTALQAASYKGHVEIVQLLIAYGAHLNTCSGSYHTAITAACVACEIEVINTLLKAGASINGPLGGHYGFPLQAAARHAHSDVVRTLLRAGADVNARAGYHGTALRAALKGGHVAIAEMLRNAGAVDDEQ